jgi:hypothetical protein
MNHAMKFVHPLLVVTFVVTLFGLGGGAVWQWRESVRLRTETEQARTAQAEWRQLQAEHTRLRAAQIPATELEQLRADHAALPRLRAELEALKKRTP